MPDNDLLRMLAALNLADIPKPPWATPGYSQTDGRVWDDNTRSMPFFRLITGLLLLTQEPDEYHNLVRKSGQIALHNPSAERPDGMWAELAEEERDIFHNRIMAHVRRFLSNRVDLSPVRGSLVPGQTPSLQPGWWNIAHPADMPSGPALWLDVALVGYLRAELLTKGPKSKDEEARAELVLERMDTVERKALARWETWTGQEKQVALGFDVDPWQARAGIFRMWLDVSKDEPVPMWLALLADLVWHVEAWPRILEGRRKVEALPVLFARPLAESLRTGRWNGQRIVDEKGHDLPLVFLEVPEKVAELAEGMEALGTLTAQRAFRWMARTAHRRILDGEADALEIVIPGGWQGWAREIGATSKKDADTLRDVAELAKRVTVRWQAPGEYGVLSLLEGFHIVEKAYHGRQARLVLWLSRLFSPGIAAKLPQGERALVPVLDLPSMGDLGPRLHPAAARLDWLALVALTDHAEELVRYGGAELPWLDLADRAGLARKHLATIHEAWMDRWRQKGVRWTLAESDPATRRALAFILEGGQARIAGRVKGKASARKKLIRFT
jgi:hypothetical protein